MSGVTELHCPATGLPVGADGATHHLVPRAAGMTCRYCGQTEAELRAAADVARAARADYDIPARLAAIRTAIDAETVSYGELAELQALKAHIPAGDVVLLEWAGVPEHDGTDA